MELQNIIDTYARTADLGFQFIGAVERNMVNHGGQFGDQRINLANQVEIWGLQVEVIAKLAIGYPHASWAGISAQYIGLFTWGTELLKVIKS